MNPKRYFGALLLFVTGIASLKCNDGSFNKPADAASHFNRNVNHLVYTKHARCRMDCRHISQADIAAILHNGEINYDKTDENDRPCPTYALQGNTESGEHLRVIFAQCETTTKVVTCYNLEEDFVCHCPGDEKKNH